MRYTADRMLGRRYQMPIFIGNTIGGFLDVSIVGWDPQGSRVRVHCDNGERAWWALDDVIALINGGQLEEVAAVAFVLEPETRRVKGSR